MRERRGSGSPSEAYRAAMGYGRIQLRLPKPVLRDVKFLAARDGVSAAKLIERLVSDELARGK